MSLPIGFYVKLNSNETSKIICFKDDVGKVQFVKEITPYGKAILTNSEDEAIQHNVREILAENRAYSLWWSGFSIGKFSVAGFGPYFPCYIKYDYRLLLKEICLENDSWNWFGKPEHIEWTTSYDLAKKLNTMEEAAEILVKVIKLTMNIFSNEPTPISPLFDSEEERAKKTNTVCEECGWKFLCIIWIVPPRGSGGYCKATCPKCNWSKVLID